jgi:hypothetical protein
LIPLNTWRVGFSWRMILVYTTALSLFVLFSRFGVPSSLVHMHLPYLCSAGSHYQHPHMFLAALRRRCHIIDAVPVLASPKTQQDCILFIYFLLLSSITNSDSTTTAVMPEINRIHIELQCQQDLSRGGPIEEFAPRQRTPGDTVFMPDLYDRETNTCSVFIPIFPRAQFLLKYDAKPPERSSTTDAAGEDVFYVFQLFIGKDEITTWSCGESQSWQGKTSFAMFDTSNPEIHTNGKHLEKRVFMFNGDTRVSGDMTCDKDEDRKIELRVFRADKSMRTPKQPETYEGQGVVDEIQTPHGGNTATTHPKKYFIFGLVDSLDLPHAVFRWYYRSWEEINRLRLKFGEAKDEASVSVFAPGIQVTKDPTRKTIAVKNDRTSVGAAARRMIVAGIQQRPPSLTSNSPSIYRSDRPPLVSQQPVSVQPRGTITLAPNVLRYDKATGAIVSMLEEQTVNTSSLQNSLDGPNNPCQFSLNDTSHNNHDPQQYPRRSSIKTSNVSSSSSGPQSPSRSKHGSIHIPAAMLLPPQHPDAHRLPPLIPVHYQQHAQQGQHVGRIPGLLPCLLLRNHGKPLSTILVPPFRGGRPNASPNVKAWRHI